MGVRGTCRRNGRRADAAAVRKVMRRGSLPATGKRHRREDLPGSGKEGRAGVRRVGAGAWRRRETGRGGGSSPRGGTELAVEALEPGDGHETLDVAQGTRRRGRRGAPAATVSRGPGDETVDVQRPDGGSA